MGSNRAIAQASIRFGDEFELDVEVRQLRRAGRVLKLERIPFDILRFLVEHAGHVVTRDQIVERIWGTGAFLDTDNSINGAIRKIRLALKDHSDRPRFVETLPGVGYRFVAPLKPRTDKGSPTEEPAPPHPVAVAPDIVIESSDPKQARWPRRAIAVLGAVSIVAAGAWLVWASLQPQSQTDGRVMLAVLPFENLTGDAEQEYFSDGLTEELIAQLGRLDPRRLGVIARTSVMRYKEADDGLPKIARDLGVHFVLEGSVRRDSHRVRITAQLIPTSDQTHVWAYQWDREEETVLTVQAEIAQSVAREVRLTLEGKRSEPLQSATRSPNTFQAYDLYLKGRYFWNKRTPEGFRLAIESFERALAMDPDYARARAGLADAYTLLGSYGIAPHRDVIPKARAEAIRALQLDETLAEAHTSLALISEQYDWDWPKAESEFRRAIALDPNYATAHHWYAEYLGFQGRFDEALAESEIARQLDPLSLIVATDNAVLLYFSRRPNEAIQQFRAVLAVEPIFPRVNLVTSAYLQGGDVAAALSHLDRWLKLDDGPWTWAWAAHIQGRAGNRAEAERALQRMEAANRHHQLYEPPLYATAYAGTDKDKAFAWLQQACSDHSNFLSSLKVDPVFDPLRDDPRFEELLRCARLTPAN
jgi:TolB-like protein/DNA-binding winged helix-turn-helix (wHTH) protein/Tfp pilus assembly protein PilF